MRFGPVPSVPSLPRRPPLARTQLQPISRKREQNNSYRGANTCARERERKRRGNTESGVKRERKERIQAGVEGREKEREKESETFILRHPGRARCPLSAFSPSVSPVNPILEACRARFLNFVTFKFKHSHLLRSPPPPLLPMPISRPFPLSLIFLSPSFLSLLFYHSFIISLLSFHYLYARLYILRRFFLQHNESTNAPTFRGICKRTFRLIYSRRIFFCLDMKNSIV